MAQTAHVGSFLEALPWPVAVAVNGGTNIEIIQEGVSADTPPHMDPFFPCHGWKILISSNIQLFILIDYIYIDWFQENCQETILFQPYIYIYIYSKMRLLLHVHQLNCPRNPGDLVSYVNLERKLCSDYVLLSCFVNRSWNHWLLRYSVLGQTTGSVRNSRYSAEGLVVS